MTKLCDIEKPLTFCMFHFQLSKTTTWCYHILLNYLNKKCCATTPPWACNCKQNKNKKLKNKTGTAVVCWLSSWLAEPGLTTTISEIGYLLSPSRDMAERSLKRRKSSKQPTNQPKKNPHTQTKQRSKTNKYKETKKMNK